MNANVYSSFKSKFAIWLKHPLHGLHNKDSYGSFPLSGTVLYSTIWYAIMSVSIVRSCEWYQNSEPHRKKFLVPFRWGT